METINIIAICLNVLILGMLIYGGHKASKEKLLLILKIDGILLLCFLPVIIILFAFAGISIKEIISSPTSFISTITLICIINITLIQYLLKRRKESQEVKNRTEVEVEISKHKKRLRKIMIPACILPILVFVFLLLDESIRSNRLLFSFIIANISIFSFLLIFFMRKLKNDI